jgi:hypothetical protein
MKKQISSDTTLIWKYLFPGLWIAFMGIGVITTGNRATREPGWFVFLLAWLAISGYLIWSARRLKFVSMDEDFLYVWVAFKETQIPLAHVQRVKENFWARPKLITLILNQPSEFGTQIVFVPTSLLFTAVRSHPIVKEIETAVRRNRSRFQG